MNRLIFSITCLLCFTIADAQSIDGSFAFQNDAAKKYSLYIPSNYDADTPSALMLGLHPLNTNRWDAAAWRDTLLVFAETNNLILACPDGGLDGRVDDAIDTAFTTVLLDSVAIWYNINPSQRYAMGFSWGGKTTYTYGLRRPELFNGYMVIGPAATVADIDDIKENASGKPFYLINGSSDNPGTRLLPFIDVLKEQGACVESSLLTGEGHTIDFPDRNNILTQAYKFIHDSNCGESSTSSPSYAEPNIYPNPVKDNLVIDGISPGSTITIMSLSGKMVPFELQGNKIQFSSDDKGLLIVKISDHKSTVTKTIVRF